LVLEKLEVTKDRSGHNATVISWLVLFTLFWFSLLFVEYLTSLLDIHWCAFCHW